MPENLTKKNYYAHLLRVANKILGNGSERFLQCSHTVKEALYANTPATTADLTQKETTAATAAAAAAAKATATAAAAATWH